MARHADLRAKTGVVVCQAVGIQSALGWTRTDWYRQMVSVREAMLSLSFTHGKMQLFVRAWTCPECGIVHDRDVNAARNVLAAGRAVLSHRESGNPSRILCFRVRFAEVGIPRLSGGERSTLTSKI